MKKLNSMKEFDYIIIGGGCAGLSLAYELEAHEKFKDKTLAIIEPRNDYKRDKTWSFWKISDHNFEDCVKHVWSNFSINIPNKTIPPTTTLNKTTLQSANTLNNNTPSPSTIL